MKLNPILRIAMLIATGLTITVGASAAEPTQKTQSVVVNTVKAQLIRNATIKLTYGGTTFLVDPMLAAQGAYKGFEGTPRSNLRNPLIPLPVPVSEVLKADAVVLTHLHEDHWDQAARTLVPRNMPIFTQNEADAATVRKDGFTNVGVLTEAGVDFNGTRLYKTGGQHGSDQMYAVPQVAEVLGKVMGIVFKRPGYKTAYVVGDTVWNQYVDAALNSFKPDVIFLNSGYAQIDGLPGSIIMGKDDVLRAYEGNPNAKIVAIHMDAVNHALLSRTELRAFITEKRLDPARALVPKDGESYEF